MNDTIKKVKRTSLELEEILANHISDKRYIFTINIYLQIYRNKYILYVLKYIFISKYISILQLNNKKIINLKIG